MYMYMYNVYECVFYAVNFMLFSCVRLVMVMVMLSINTF